MAVTVLIHVAGEESVLCELDDYPNPTDTLIVVSNPRRRDGKDLHYILPDVTTVIWPLERIMFIEVMPTATDDEVISFVRE